MIELQAVTAGYGSPVLQNLTLAFPPGQVTAIVGPNGSGKSTLLKVAAGLLAPSAGRVSIGRKPARQVAYLPQSRTLPQMTAGRLVLHGRFPWLDYPRRYGKDDFLLAQRAMERLGVAEFAHRPLGELSGGTRQKCYLAMALCQDTPTLLLDEPTAGLDIQCQFRLLELCRELAAEGKAVVLVLHDLTLALGWADRVVVLEAGRVAMEGDPAQVAGSGLLGGLFGIRLVPLADGAQTRYLCLPQENTDACPAIYK